MSNREKKVNSSLNNEECEKKVKVKEKEIERFHDIFGVGGKRVFMWSTYINDLWREER